ncbi:MAG: AAA family ATPase [Desulfobacterales bacterium]|nr:AAA family ATPase [Desulfobacterales bacterium]
MFNFAKKSDLPNIIVCCGSGGVGKTTISATLGLHGALTGQKTLVLTIDPARRLADSLGIGSLEYEVQKVPDEKFKALGIDPAGELYAMMLDTKRTFDHLITKYAPANMQQNILKNRYYQHISSTLAGSHEYMAMEKVYEIYYQDQYDLIILDTPPSRRALDFLDAPQRMTNILGHNMFLKLFKPYLNAGKVGMKVISIVAAPFLKVVSQVMGGSVLEDIADFFRLWDDVLFDGFRHRANAVKALLKSSHCTFVAITSPNRDPLKESIFLYDKLKENGMHFGGFIVNRVNPIYDEEVENLRDIKNIPDHLIDKLKDNFQNFQKIGKNDASAIKKLKERVGENERIRKITYFDHDVYDFKGLFKVSRQIFAQ